MAEELKTPQSDSLDPSGRVHPLVEPLTRWRGGNLRADVMPLGLPVMDDPSPTTAEEAIIAHQACERARMKERDEKAHLLDWAESLLCNALPMPHCTQDEWDVAVKNWRDEKHGVKKPNAKPQAGAE